MIPQVQDDLKQDFTFTVLPSRTFKMNHSTKTITGTIDQVKAVEQAVFLILNVERCVWMKGIGLGAVLPAPMITGP